MRGSGQRGSAGIDAVRAGAGDRVWVSRSRSRLAFAFARGRGWGRLRNASSPNAALPTGQTCRTTAAEHQPLPPAPLPDLRQGAVLSWTVCPRVHGPGTEGPSPVRRRVTVSQHICVQDAGAPLCATGPDRLPERRRVSRAQL